MQFLVKDFLKLPSDAKIRETARQNWEIYQLVEHSAYAHKFFIIFWKNLKNPKSANFPLRKLAKIGLLSNIFLLWACIFIAEFSEQTATIF